LFLTGQRREEVGGMRWSELDLKEKLWSLPSDRTKNGRPHDVPLTGPVLQILASRDRPTDRDFVFGKGKGPFSGWSKAKASLDSKTGLRDWRLHDLKWTAVTGMAELGFQPHIIEAIVDHLSGHKSGVAGIYNRATYAAEKRDALGIWSDYSAPRFL
jgi:integrase